jgi:hypothetical protein
VDSLLPLRLVVLRPPAGTEFRLQRGRVGVGAGPTPIAPTHATPDALTFDFTVLLGDEPQADGRPALGGAFAHGTTRDRFVYVASGRPAAEGAPWQWDRRAKVPLAGITPELIDAVLGAPDAVLEARIEGTAPDGRAVAARVALAEGGWRVVPGR